MLIDVHLFGAHPLNLNPRPQNKNSHLTLDRCIINNVKIFELHLSEQTHNITLSVVMVRLSCQLE